MRACMQIMALSLHSDVVAFGEGSNDGCQKRPWPDKKEQRNPAKERVGTKEV